MSEKPSTSTQATDDQVIADARYIEFIDFSETAALAILQRTIKPTVAALLRKIDSLTWAQTFRTDRIRRDMEEADHLRALVAWDKLPNVELNMLLGAQYAAVKYFRDHPDRAGYETPED